MGDLKKKGEFREDRTTGVEGVEVRPVGHEGTGRKAPGVLRVRTDGLGRQKRDERDRKPGDGEGNPETGGRRGSRIRGRARFIGTMVRTIR